MGGGSATNFELRFKPHLAPRADYFLPSAIAHRKGRERAGSRRRLALTASSAESGLVGKKTAPVPAKIGQPWPADAVERRPVASLGALRPKCPDAFSPSRSRSSQARSGNGAGPCRFWSTSRSNIIAGHGRVLAAQRLGLTEVPVMVARGWSEAQKQAYAIADNKLALNAGWDENLLRIELGELKGLGADLGLTGFGELGARRPVRRRQRWRARSRRQRQSLLPSSQPALATSGLCGEHRVLCGDATDLADVESVLAGELADMCFTDPPYGVNYAPQRTSNAANAGRS